MLPNPIQWINFLCIICLSVSSFTASGVNPQSQALLLWKTTNFRSATGLSNWELNSTIETPCQWLGVTCNSDNEVVELNLSYVDLLGGTIPSNFTSLLSLNKLLLAGTNLTGGIPNQITILKDLTDLDLSQNHLQGPIPVEIGNLSSLNRLLLFDNQLVGRIPSSVGSLKQVEIIKAGGNKNLGGDLPLEIGNCSTLVILGLAETSISGSLPRSIGFLKNLETLAIYTAMLTGKIPDEIGDCDELRNVYLYENSLLGSIPKELGKLRNLEEILLWQNDIEGNIPSQIGMCDQLRMIDFSMNSLTGGIPKTFGNLTNLIELQLSVNRISGQIPFQIGNNKGMTRIALDNNQISGTVPPSLGNMANLTQLYLWQNLLEGNIPESLSACQNLQIIDFSQNRLTGSIPGGIFLLQKLSKLLLLSNNLTGAIPQQIGNCSSLIRFRAGNNNLNGTIPPQIGKLSNLSFLDLGSNSINGSIPEEISGCRNLTFLDLHSNFFAGKIPEDLGLLRYLELLDVSDNFIAGNIRIRNLGALNLLSKLVLRNNRFTGSIPIQLESCTNLQFLDLSSNNLSGEIPASLGLISSLEIALNLSWNHLSGSIPAEFAALEKLGVLDLSHNNLSGNLNPIASLQNLVVVNLSHNKFSGRIPNSTFFTKLPPYLLAGNSLCLDDHSCTPPHRAVDDNLAMAVLLAAAFTVLSSSLYIAIAIARNRRREIEEDGDMDLPWKIMLYQKLSISIADVALSMTPGNIIGQGRSGVVYRVTIPSGLTLAVKKFQSSGSLSDGGFSSEIETLAGIRHRNIIRLIGWAANRKVRLVFYDYVANGTLGAWLHAEGRRVELGEWERRFRIAVGVAEGLAYLHHDCAPAIVHRDVKAQNILLGDACEPLLADFGLARVVIGEHGSSPHLVGSYGYIAPEYGSILNITEKSDVFSYGVVLLEILTGKMPVDPLFSSEEQHIVQWVQEHLNSSKKYPTEILDPNLRAHVDDTHVQEMLQALGISLLCTSNRAEDRPTMKNIVALLRGIRHELVSGDEPNKLTKPKLSDHVTHSMSSSNNQTTPMSGSIDYSSSSRPISN